MKTRVTVVLNEHDSFYPEREYIEGKVLLMENNRFEFESDDDINAFNEKTVCWTDREAYKLGFYSPKITVL